MLGGGGREKDVTTNKNVSREGPQERERESLQAVGEKKEMVSCGGGEPPGVEKARVRDTEVEPPAQTGFTHGVWTCRVWGVEREKK